MPRHNFERAKIELKELDHQLTERLCVELRKMSVKCNSLFFHTKEFNPHGLPDHLLSKSADELLRIARQTLKLRELLVMPTDRCVGHLFEEALKESANARNEQRLGPRRLAVRLLSQIEELGSASW